MRINTNPSLTSLPSELESRLADELDRITEQIQQGKKPDVSHLVNDYPDMAETIHAYVRQIELLQGAGGNDSNILGLAGSGSSASVADSDTDNSDPNELRIGDYRIEHEIGRGGMGIVYAARQISLDRPVALKILPFASSLDKMQITRFRNEARAAGQLHHPNIVPVFAVGCEDEVHFYAMQKIVGESLESVFRSQKGEAPGTDATPTWLDTSPDEPKSNSEIAKIDEPGENNPNKVSSQKAATVFAESNDWLKDSESGQSFDPDATASLPEQSPSTKRVKETLHSGTMGISGIDKLDASGSTSASAKVFEFAEPTSVKYHRQIARVGIQVAEALQYAHECGIIHRDIKPSNLLLDRNGKVWITDFGLARVQSDAGLTQTGDVIGTVRYMSPEQASGDLTILDQRTDVYSLGITLYELITLHEAFHGLDRREMLWAIEEKDPITPRRLNSSIPIDLETIVLKAISKKPEQRYASAQELADDLERFLDGRPTLARRPTPAERLAKWAGRHRTAVRVAMALLMVAMIGLGITSFMIARAHNQLQLAHLQLSDANNRLEDTNNQLEIALDESNTSKMLAFKSMQEAKDNAQRAEANAQRAEKNYAQARKLLDTFGSRYAEELKDIAGAEPLRRAILSETLDYYDDFIKQAKNDSDLRRDLALTYSRIGNISDQLGNRDKSITSYTEAKQILQEMVRKEPNNPQHQAELALCTNNLGQLLDSNGKHNSAREQFVAATEIFTKLIEKYPEEAQYQAGLALVDYNLGLLNFAIGNLADARNDLEKARELQESILKRDPKNIEYASRLAATYDNLNRVYLVTDPKKAIQNCLKSIEIQKKLAEEHPKERELQSGLALSYHNLGVLQRKAGQNEEAAASYRKAIEILTTLVKQAPAVVEYRLHLAITENNLGQILVDLQQYVAAGKAFDNSRLALTGLVHEHPHDPNYLSSLGGTLNNLGMIFEKLDRDTDAAQTYFQAIKYQHEAHKLAPKVKRYREFLDKQYVNYSLVLQKLKRYDEAYKVIQERKRLWEGRPEKLLKVASEIAVLVTTFERNFPNPTPEQSATQKKMADAAIETLYEALDAGVLTSQTLQEPEFNSLRENPRFRMLSNTLNRG